MFDNIDIKTTGTRRLLNIYRQLRSILLHGWPSSRGYTDLELAEIERDHERLNAMKAELDTREHVPRRPRRRRGGR